jgi:hypothetical protein
MVEFLGIPHLVEMVPVVIDVQQSYVGLQQGKVG